MATSFQARADRENTSNSVSKNSVSKTAPGQRSLSTKTPRKALGDVGNMPQHDTAKKFQTPNPSKVKIFDETPEAKTSVKSKKPAFSVLNTHRQHSRVLSDVKIKTKSENSLPDIEKMIPYVDQEDDLPRPKHITRLLKHRRLLNPSFFSSITFQDDPITPSYQPSYLLEDIELPVFDETIANIVGYDEEPPLFDANLLDLPPLEDLPPLPPLPPLEDY